MKKVLLLGVALTMGLNSISMAASSSNTQAAYLDRVLEIAAKTSVERTALRRQLIDEMKESVDKLASLRLELARAKSRKDTALVLSIASAVAAAGGIILAVLSARRMNLEKSLGGTFMDMGFVTASSAVTALFLSATDITQADFIISGKKVDELDQAIQGSIDSLNILQEKIVTLDDLNTTP